MNHKNDKNNYLKKKEKLSKINIDSLINPSSWIEKKPCPKTIKRLKNTPELKDFWWLIDSVEKSRKNTKDRYKRTPLLFCRFILEFICQFLLVKGINNRKITLNKIKKKFKKNKKLQKCTKIDALFYYLSLEEIIHLLKEIKIIGVRDQNTISIQNLIKNVQDDSNEALHLKLDSKYNILNTSYKTKYEQILSQTNSLIWEFLELYF